MPISGTTRFGRRIPIPSTRQIRHELLVMMREEARSTHRQAEANALDSEIDKQQARIDDMPLQGSPGPAAGIATMDRAIAENDLIELKNERTRRGTDPKE